MMISAITIIGLTMKPIEAIAEKSGFAECLVETVINTFREFVIEQLTAGYSVQLREFLIFDFKDMPERVRRNPRTGGTLVVPAGRSPKIRISNSFKKDFMENQVDSQLTLPDSIPTTPPPLPTTITPPPLPPALEKTYHLPDGQQKSASDVKKFAHPTDLIWHPDFGTQWRKVGDVLS